MTDKKPFVLALCGPPKPDKTCLSAELAAHYGGEVISADSMQIDKGMDIASARPTAEEMRGIPHHLIDFLDMGTSFSAADYVALANEKIQEVLSRGKLPIIVGGTGLYIDSLLNNVKFSEAKEDPEYRRSLYEFAERNGKSALYDKLLNADPEAAENIHMNNLVRVVRALEVIHVTGRKFSELKAESRSEESPYDSLIIGLNAADRSVLYNRIDLRVDDMGARLALAPYIMSARDLPCGEGVDPRDTLFTRPTHHHGLLLQDYLRSQSIEKDCHIWKNFSVDQLG